jgi:hypothetical protein
MGTSGTGACEPASRAIKLEERPEILGALVPIKVRPDIGAALAASLTDEQRFEIGQSDMVGHRPPLIAVQWLHLQSEQ